MKKNEETREIDVDKIDLDRLKTQVAALPSILQYAHDRGSALINPEDIGKQKSRAIAAMQEQTKREFKQIVDQMAPLMEQMELLKKRVYMSEIIYQAHIPFDPIIGQSYFVYNKEDGNTVLSMISPSEWGKSMPFKSYEGRVKLLSDHTWEVED